MLYFIEKRIPERKMVKSDTVSTVFNYKKKQFVSSEDTFWNHNRIQASS